MITADQLLEIFPDAPAAEFTDPLNAAMDEFDVSTPLRQAAFLAQVGIESNSLNFLSENLNYSAQGLLNTFRKHFTPEEAQRYARNPEAIANRAYANRYGNGDEASGDGWRYRGAGLIQITFHDNHAAAAEYFNMDVDEFADWARTPEGACRSAGLFWKKNGCNQLADAGDIDAVTRKVNGGMNGAQEREGAYQDALRVLT